MSEKELDKLFLKLKSDDLLVRVKGYYALYQNVLDHQERDWSILIPLLIVGSKDELPQVRQNAISVLGTIGKPAIPALIGLLENEAEDVRGYAAVALKRIGEPAIPALIDALKNSDEKVRLLSGVELTHIGKPAIPALIDALKDESEVSLQIVLALLSKIGPRSAEDLELLHKAAWEFRKEYSRKMGKERLEWELKRIHKTYSEWSEILKEHADRIASDKKFHLPKSQKQDKTERVLRVRRLGA